MTKSRKICRLQTCQFLYKQKLTSYRSVLMISLTAKRQQKLNSYNKLEMPNLLKTDHFSQAIDQKRTIDNVPCKVNEINFKYYIGFE